MTADDVARALEGTPERDAPEGAGGLDPATAAEVAAVRALLAGEAVWVEPPEGLADAVVAAVARAAAEAPPHLAEAPPLLAEAPPHLADASPAPGGRRRSFSKGVVVGAAAAVLVAAALLVGLLVVRRSDTQPQLATITLAGTELLPEARGEVHVYESPSGLKLELEASGLPRRDGDEYYEAWLRNPESGVLVPIGTFHSGEDVVLWAGVSLQDFPMLTITREAADGDQASSGQRVLAGSVPARGG